MKPTALIAVKIVTAICGILLNIYGASVAGTEGVAFAALASSVIYFTWMSYLARPTRTAAEPGR